MSQQDGSYLLGALLPEERRSYEEHLAGCASCSAGLAEVAGLPGLLGRLPADAIAADDPPPADVLPALLATVTAERRRTRRRVRLAAAALATAAAVVAAILIGPGPVVRRPDPAQQSFSRVAGSPVTASVALVDRAWGTEIDMRCSYRGYVYPAGVPYELTATDRGGHQHVLATWLVVSDKPVKVVASTSLKRSDLVSLEVRSVLGAVARLRP